MSAMSELDLLREEYIDHILDGCDGESLTDMARAWLEHTTDTDPTVLISIIRSDAPHLLNGSRFEDQLELPY